MPGIYKAMNVAFRLASRFKQCLDGCALVNIACNQLPPFLLAQADRVVRKLWCVDQRVEIVRYVGSAQGGVSQLWPLCRSYHVHIKLPVAGRFIGCNS